MGICCKPRSLKSRLKTILLCAALGFRFFEKLVLLDEVMKGVVCLAFDTPKREADDLSVTFDLDSCCLVIERSAIWTYCSYDLIDNR